MHRGLVDDLHVKRMIPTRLVYADFISDSLTFTKLLAVFGQKIDLLRHRLCR